MAQTYDPAFVGVTFKGIPISGYADGTFIKIERNNPTFKQYVGARGEVSYVKSQDKTGKATLTLKADHPCNDLLSTVATQDELLGNGVGVFQMTQGGGATIALDPEARIEKPTHIERGKEMPTTEWVFLLSYATLFSGGTVPVISE